MRIQQFNTIGKSAAIFAAFFAIAYSVFQILAAFKIIPHPDELFWLFLPSILLCLAYLVTIISLHYYVPATYRMYTSLGMAFGILYCAMVSMVYFIQLAVFIPALQQGKVDENHLLAFSESSMMVALDCLGYAFMSMSAFFTAIAFRDYKNKWLFRSLYWSGLLAPVIILAFFIPEFMFIGALWMITIPMAMINAAKLFSNSQANDSAVNIPRSQSTRKKVVPYEIL